MKELKYIRKVSEAYPYDYEQPPICKVELWDFSHANENDEARKEAVCLVASISYGNEYCKDPNKLWNLLIERGHESPFEFVRGVIDATEDMYLPQKVAIYNLRECEPGNELPTKQYIATFKLKVPIFVARQIWLDENIYNWFYWYATEIDDIRPEQARAFLPLGLYTQFWMQGDYKAWLNFFIHRLHPDAQEETRLVAQAMWNLLKEHQPEIIGTMADYLEEWTKDCNPMFTPAREKKAEWFTKEFLGE